MGYSGREESRREEKRGEQKKGEESHEHVERGRKGMGSKRARA